MCVCVRASVDGNSIGIDSHRRQKVEKSRLTNATQAQTIERTTNSMTIPLKRWFTIPYRRIDRIDPSKM